ncbi:uncharacterized protein [Rutidosis leptorrhynchoides]|uniref:uncharacterized protein n=1 Tax=Rutidosis leptorrhynchoides TaxID=125765 RepID=UPI003A990572
MAGWIHVGLVVLAAGIFLFLLFFFFRNPKPQTTKTLTVSKYETPSKQLFSWSDNPSLVTDAIENGWSRFAFTDYVSSTSVRSNRFLRPSCVAGDDVSCGHDDEMEISWEVCQGSADFMQKIRLNSGLKKCVKSTTTNFANSVIKSALPLPGPTLGNSCPFPQEAYFEITILSIFEDENGSDVGKEKVNNGEGEDIKLIIQENNGVNGKGVHGNFEELRGRNGTKEIVEGRNEVVVMLSVGLTAGGGGGLLPVKLPGSYPGSIGFNSDGSIYLDVISLGHGLLNYDLAGDKLETGSIIELWEKADKVIGCGYNPSQKKVFFTLDSRLVHEISCKGDEFGTPLYPTVAANSDIVVLVNFGQSTFKYTPSNQQRTQNPCFIGPLANSSSSGYEDSKELFSMGRIDSQWLNQSTIRSGQVHSNVYKDKIAKDFDEVSEGDMYEIVIESNSYRKSPLS